jgi:serine/threonine-protein kinase
MTSAPGIGAEFAGYRIEALLGRGGVGLVYLAQDLNLPRRVALKILRAEFAQDPQFRERFVRESRLAASLDHLNIVPIYRAGEVDGVLFIAMRYVDGTDLRRLLSAEGPLDIDRALTILGQVGGALDAAHAQGLIHRDVKPANILVGPGVGDGAPDQAYLVDFGITKRTTTAGLTQAGLFVGTLDYAAPEQIRGQAVDARTDVYSLGCVLFECLAGAAPFRRDTDLDTMQAHLSAERPRLSPLRPEMGAAMDHVVTTAMAREPDDRYGSATALITAARAARPWTGLDRRSSTHPPLAASPPPAPPPPAPARPARARPKVRIPAQAPRPVVPAAPPPPPQSVPAPSVPAPRPARRLPPLAAAFGALVAVAAGAVILLSHRGGDTGAATSPSSTAAPPPGPLLVLTDFAPGSVAPADSQLQLKDISCGVTPSKEVGEKRVAFTGRGDTAHRGYFNAAASFSTVDDARTYLDQVTAAAQRCPVPPRLDEKPLDPAIGDGSARVLFHSKPEADPAITFDAVYVRKGKVVGLVLVSVVGTNPPPAGDAPAFARLALNHMAAAGP